MKNKYVIFLLGFISATVLIVGITLFTGYNRNVNAMLMTQIYYNDEVVGSYLPADAWGYLTHGNFKLYFGKLPDKSIAIEISSPFRAIIYIYPRDEKSVIIEYKPDHGINLNFIESYIGFNRFLELFNDLKRNQVFNETVSY